MFRILILGNSLEPDVLNLRMGNYENKNQQLLSLQMSRYLQLLDISSNSQISISYFQVSSVEHNIIIEKQDILRKTYPYIFFVMTMNQSLLMALVSLPFCVLESWGLKK